MTLLLVALLLLLLLGCCWISFWPLGVSEQAAVEEIVRSREQASVSIRDAEASIIPEVFVGTKGQAWLVSFTLESGVRRAVLPESFAIDVNGSLVPPLRPSDSDVEAFVEVPTVLEPAAPAHFAVVFAIPRATADATLTVQFHDMTSDQRALAPVSVRMEGVE